LTSSESSLTDRLANHWRVALPLVLRPGEEVILALELDLNQQLQFSNGLVCLTNLGLIAFDNQHDLSTTQDPASWNYWNFADDLKLHLHDHAGVATLELFNRDGRLALWRFTLAQNPVANRLLQQ
jgi:ATP-binding cassette subfamily B protein